ncbi:uncharacterized protein LOC124808557 [Hydra vulgaris]|uniref:uncharacterized protein LOC124808557 n=1 Tax=Hydra vulgaris TaxID=6087 RepID=UPI0032E9E9F2
MKENNPILHYKLQGEPDTSHQFEVSDFIIIIQTEHQKNMFQQFGRAGVCIDSTHGTNGYDFLLTTLLVVDELGEGQPAGWCLATSDSFNFMKLFFGKLKENSGNIYPIWIMTDMAAQYYDAFCNVYTCAPLKLWCTWHVDRAWRDEIHKKKKKNTEMEVDVYKRLRFILQLSDRKLLDDYLNSFMLYLQSFTLTKSFAEYFQKYWECKKHFWASCYRIGHGINTNMYLESFHKTFKYNYLNGKHNKRIDNCLFKLLKFNRDKVYERLIKLTKGKNSYKLNLIYSRHVASLHLSLGCVIEEKGKWFVQSENNNDQYEVIKHHDICNIIGCLTKCTKCQVCSHLYHCSCMDFLTKNIPCKHIHLIHRLGSESKFKKNTLVSLPPVDLESKTICNVSGDVQTLKSNIIKNLMGLVKLVSSSTISEEKALKNLNKNISQATSTFHSLSENRVEQFFLKENIRSNKKLTKQPQVLFNKKKEKKFPLSD